MLGQQELKYQEDNIPRNIQPRHARAQSLQHWTRQLNHQDAAAHSKGTGPTGPLCSAPCQRSSGWWWKHGGQLQTRGRSYWEVRLTPRMWLWLVTKNTTPKYDIWPKCSRPVFMLFGAEWQSRLREIFLLLYLLCCLEQEWVLHWLPWNSTWLFQRILYSPFYSQCFLFFSLYWTESIVR